MSDSLNSPEPPNSSTGSIQRPTPIRSTARGVSFEAPTATPSLRARLASTNPRIVQRNTAAAAASILALPPSRAGVRNGVNTTTEPSSGSTRPLRSATSRLAQSRRRMARFASAVQNSPITTTSVLSHGRVRQLQNEELSSAALSEQEFRPPSRPRNSTQRLFRLTDSTSRRRNTTARSTAENIRSRISALSSKSSTSPVKLELDPVHYVLNSKKYLPKVLKYLNWNELLVVRTVCQDWFKICSEDPTLQENSGVISFRSIANFNRDLKIFNGAHGETPYWRKFRILVPIVYDMTNSTQLEFWDRYGPTMNYLEIENRAITLSGLIEILKRCQNLKFLSVTWGPEMYSFNSEMIKKYYGVHFRNGTFSKLENLVIKKSLFLTDNALWSLLKWCGSSLKSLTLACSPETRTREDMLHQLRPRWSLEPLRNFTERFGYAGGLTHLNFSNSNVNNDDLRALAVMHHLDNLLSINLSFCEKIDESSITFFIGKKGAKLQELNLDSLPISEQLFDNCRQRLPKLSILNISGGKSNFVNIDFLAQLRTLLEFSCARTAWLDYLMLVKTLKLTEGRLKKIDVSGNIRLSNTGASKHLDSNMNKIWFSNLCSVLGKELRHLDLTNWSQFGNNENFRTICATMSKLQVLKLKGWKYLTDAGITGVSNEMLQKEDANAIDEWSLHDKSHKSIAMLKDLNYLDVSGCDVTDNSARYGFSLLTRLRTLKIDGTHVSDTGLIKLIGLNQSIDTISVGGCKKITYRNRRSMTRSDGRIVILENM